LNAKKYLDIFTLECSGYFFQGQKFIFAEQSRECEWISRNNLCSISGAKFLVLE
jgi:hypothetical protein